MVVMVMSKRWSKAKEEVKRILQSELLKWAFKEKLKSQFVSDSKAIQDSVDDISTRLADLLETTRLEPELKG